MAARIPVPISRIINETTGLLSLDWTVFFNKLVNQAATSGSRPAGGSPGQVQFNNSGLLDGFTVSGDATLNTSTGAITVTKTSGYAFATVAKTGAYSDLSGKPTLGSLAAISALHGSLTLSMAGGATSYVISDAAIATSSASVIASTTSST